MKLKKILAGMLAAAIAVTGIPMLPATEGLEKVSKDLGVVKEAKAATGKDWGEAVPDSSIQVGDTIEWNGKKFKAVLEGNDDYFAKHSGQMLMLSQDSFGQTYWGKYDYNGISFVNGTHILNACSEHGENSLTADWYSGLTSQQTDAMYVNPEYRVESVLKVNGAFNSEDFAGSIQNTRLFPPSVCYIHDYNEELFYNGYDYWTCSGSGRWVAQSQAVVWGVESNSKYVSHAFLIDEPHDVCPAFYLKICSHTNPSSSVLTPATCTSNGTTQYTCSCGETWTAQDIPALGHSSVNGGTAGAHTKCSRCGAILSDAHSYTTSIDQAQSCTNAEITRYTCACGYTYTATTRQPLGHTYDTNYTTVGGRRSRICTRCHADETDVQYLLTVRPGRGIDTVLGDGQWLSAGATATIDATVKTGYTWKEWNDGAVKVKDDKHVTVTMPAYAYNLTAVATPNEYIIEYKLNGGMTNNPSKYTIEDGENGFLTLNNPTKAGYEFVGWTGSNGNTPEKNVKVNTQALVKYTYEANWQIIDYTLHCGLEGGTVAIANPTTYNIETPDITLNNPTKPGYVFEGWTGDCGAVPKKVVTIPQGSSGTKFYLANWKEADDTRYKVEHYKEKADGSFELAETDNLQGTTGSTVHPAVKNYIGYASPEVSLLTIAADGSSVLKYYYAFKKYKVALVEGEGLEYITGDGLYPCDSEVTIKTKAKPGYRFVGWERESDHQMFDEANYSFTMPSNPVTYSAITEMIPLHITYDLDGGVVSGPALVSTYNVKTPNFTIDSEIIRDGYLFCGWTGDCGEIPKRTINVNCSEGKNLNFKANWTRFISVSVPITLNIPITPDTTENVVDIPIRNDSDINVAVTANIVRTAEGTLSPVSQYDNEYMLAADANGSEDGWRNKSSNYKRMALYLVGKQANGFMADCSPLYADASAEGKTAKVGAIAAHSVGTLKAVCNHVTAYTHEETIGEYKVSWTLTQQN